MDLKNNYALVILAGGDATRLEMEIPKGCVSLHGISLIERLVRKGPKQIAIMTSQKNEKAIKSLVESLGIFDKKIILFTQNSAPFVGIEGEGPIGNGDLFRALDSSSVLGAFEKGGIERIVVCPVDNPLADPSIPQLHQSEELIVLGVEKRGENEAVGTLIEGDKLSVREYLYGEEDGLGYTGIFSAKLPFFRRAANQDHLVPFHLVKKTYNGQTGQKKEKFIFDFFLLAKSYKVEKIDRKLYFLPIKRKSGLDSLEEALKVLT